MRNQHDLFLLTGANLGDRYQSLTFATGQLLEKLGGLVVMSAVYQTAAWGSNSLHAYLNQALWLRTSYKPEQVLEITLEIEKSAGRERGERWADRTLDIDILFYDQLVLQTDRLQLPHPQLHNRRFVLAPLAEIAPTFNHPVLQQDVATLLEICTDTLDVSLWEPRS